MAVAKHQQAIADGEQLGELRRDDDDPFAAIRQRADYAEDLRLGLDVDTGRRFVHDQDVGLGGQPFADDDFLLIAAGEQPHGRADRACLDPQIVDDRSGHPVATTVVDDPGVVQAGPAAAGAGCS